MSCIWETSLGTPGLFSPRGPPHGGPFCPLLLFTELKATEKTARSSRSLLCPWDDIAPLLRETGAQGDRATWLRLHSKQETEAPCTSRVSSPHMASAARGKCRGQLWLRTVSLRRLCPSPCSHRLTGFGGTPVICRPRPGTLTVLLEAQLKPPSPHFVERWRTPGSGGSPSAGVPQQVP